MKVTVFIPAHATASRTKPGRVLTPDQSHMSCQLTKLSLEGVISILEHNCVDRRVRITMSGIGTPSIAYLNKVDRHSIESAFKNIADSLHRFDITCLEILSPVSTSKPFFFVVARLGYNIRNENLGVSYRMH